MNTVPIAEKFIDNYDSEYYLGEVFGNFAYSRNTLKEAMIEFAKLHAQAALKAASNVYLSGEIDQRAFDKMGEEILSEKALKYNKKQILKSYPLTNIK